MFAVVRHPDVAALGILPQGAYDIQRVRGWIRVSEWRAEPADFHLPEFAESFTDLDAEPQQPASPAAPKKIKEQAS